MDCWTKFWLMLFVLVDLFWLAYRSLLQNRQVFWLHLGATSYECGPFKRIGHTAMASTSTLNCRHSSNTYQVCSCLQSTQVAHMWQRLLQMATSACGVNLFPLHSQAKRDLLSVVLVRLELLYAWTA